MDGANTIVKPSLDLLRANRAEVLEIYEKFYHVGIAGSDASHYARRGTTAAALSAAYWNLRADLSMYAVEMDRQIDSGIWRIIDQAQMNPPASGSDTLEGATLILLGIQHEAADIIWTTKTDNLIISENPVISDAFHFRNALICMLTAATVELCSDKPLAERRIKGRQSAHGAYRCYFEGLKAASP